jgi:hypothetical protein
MNARPLNGVLCRFESCRGCPVNITISSEDYYMLIRCAQRRGSRLPFGVIPEHLWALLTPQQQADLNQRAFDDENIY